MAKRFFGKKDKTKNLIPQEGGDMVSLFQGDFYREVDALLRDFLESKYRANALDILGSGWVQWDKAGKIQWQRDPVAPFSWDASLPSSNQLALGLEIPLADVKRPWEMARFQHFVQWLSMTPPEHESNESIAETFHQWFTDFINSNPMGFGVHWMNAMEVSIRAINGLVITDVLRKRGQKVDKAIVDSLRDHIEFVYNHLEHKEGLGNNHYLSNLVGLLFGLVYFPNWQELQNESDFILEEFGREAKKQFFEDGGNFEGSMYYHKLGCEMLVLGLSCATRYRSKKELQSLYEITYKAVEFLKTIAKPNGELPDFGDNDSGSLLKWHPRGQWTTIAGNEHFAEDVKSVDEVVELLQGLQGRKDTLPAEWVDALALYSFEPSKSEPYITSLERPMREAGSYTQEWSISLKKLPVNVSSFYYPKTGMVICKSGNFYLAMSLLSREGAHRYRGHFHNDQLSIELWSAGESLIQDPGTYTYTGDLEIRNAMRGAKIHNAPYFGVEPNPFLPGLLGLFHQKAEAKCELLELGPKKVSALLSHHKFKVTREVFIEDEHVRIVDTANRPFEVNRGEVELKADGYGRWREE